jgi:hypothetical protein
MLIFEPFSVNIDCAFIGGFDVCFSNIFYMSFRTRGILEVGHVRDRDQKRSDVS